MKNKTILFSILLGIAVLLCTGCGAVSEEVANVTANHWYVYNSTTSINTTSNNSSFGEAKVQAEKEYTYSLASWTALYASGKITSSSGPAAGYTTFDGEIDWEHFLAQILVNKILGTDS